jgi:hypothetical protein
MEWVGHLAFGLIAISFLFRDIFWLRVLSVCASVSFIVYNYFLPHPLWLVINWNIAFLVVNAIQIGILFWERRGVRFSEEEKELYETLFSTMSPVAFMKLLRAGHWDRADAGRIWTHLGDPVTHIFLIYDGGARVMREDKTIALLEDGQFGGEMSVLKEQLVSKPTRYLSWEKKSLRALLDRNPALHGPLETILTSDLAEKLKRSRKN